MAVTSCAPAALLAKLSCLKCLSESELNKVFVLALAAGTDNYTLPDNLNTLLENSACFTCLSDKQLLQALVSAYVEDNLPELTIEEIRERIKCLNCATPKQVKAAMVYLTCVLIR
jgi:hypothetical protein